MSVDLAKLCKISVRKWHTRINYSNLLIRMTDDNYIFLTFYIQFKIYYTYVNHSKSYYKHFYTFNNINCILLLISIWDI